MSDHRKAEGRNPNDPKGLIRESFRMEGVTAEECRSIFLDWALSLPEGTSQQEAATALLAQYGEGQAAHPMFPVLTAATEAPAQAKRRGGWRARRSDMS